MKKKAQGIPMNVIIIAAIALLVLVVLVIIFMNNMGKWNTNVSSCSSRGGQCLPSCDSATQITIPDATCTGSDVCCRTSAVASP